MYAGNYSEYERNAQEKQQHMLRLQDGLNKKRAHMEKSIQVSHPSSKASQLGTDRNALFKTQAQLRRLH